MPISSSPKARLALAAVAAFGTRPFAEVGVAELAADADVTTGALYHHFGSKLGLYAFVRDDVERRLLDRVEGALATAAGDEATARIVPAIVVGFDFAVREGFLHLLDAPPPGAEADRLVETLRSAAPTASPVLADILAAALRAAVHAVGAGADADDARDALQSLAVHGSADRPGRDF
ncbi:transcriptional regulator, TetR family [Agrococcus baldri]|uniref:Transcriptional regulator, TetR family n=2 Tax=Agrococcus baldri TaxID=153730 RepID=A0AA94HLK0_9MICO|nr:transcriptional regulator, TetR family [Agrococcus baldri]